MDTRIEAIGIQAVLTAAISSLVAYTGIIIVPFIVMIMMMIIDYITGMTNAWLKKELSSKIGIHGIVKKVGCMALIAVAMSADYLISTGLTATAAPVEYNAYLGLLVTVWLTINEMISILENLKKLGVPLPAFLIKIIKRLKHSFDKEEDKSDD